MTELRFYLPEADPTLQSAIETFARELFQAETTFESTPSPIEMHKGKTFQALCRMAVVVATLEGCLQFSERVARMEQVQTLLTTLQTQGQSLYLSINGDQQVDLSTLSVDGFMNLLAEHAESTEPPEQTTK